MATARHGRANTVTLRVAAESADLIPSRAHEGDAGLDLRLESREPVVIGPGERRLLPTGVWMAIPTGFAGLVLPRSGLAAHGGLVPSTGVIDPGYRGEILVNMFNLGSEEQTLEPRQRVAQLVIVPVAETVTEEVPRDRLGATERGEGGFGSTGG